MDYDPDKVDETTLSLLFLGLTRTPTGGRAWKAFDLKTLERLHRKGWIAAPSTATTKQAFSCAMVWRVMAARSCKQRMRSSISASATRPV